MENVCLIIDMDGFTHNGNFICRELGYVDCLSEDNPCSVRFNLTEVEFNEKDYRTAMWLKHNLHGLSIKPRRGEKTYDLSELKYIIDCLHYEYSTPVKNIIAYKGGIYERNVLNELEIPNVNLELFGCPKYDVIEEKQTQFSCGFHIPILTSKKIKAVHCPMAEVATFREWMKNNQS